MIKKLFKSIFGFKASTTSTSDLRNPRFWLQDSFNIFRTSSGEAVNTTLALSIPAYFAALRIIGEDTAKLPFTVYRREGPTDRIKAVEHPVFKLLAIRPNPDMTALSFRRTITHHAANYGNGYAEIQRDGAGEVVALNPVHPTRVTIRRNAANRLVYDIRIPAKSQNEISRFAGRKMEVLRIRQENMLNISGIGGDGIRGYPIISLASETLGTNLAQQKFAGSFYRNGAHMSGVLTHPEQLSKEAKDRLREGWREKYQGVDNSHDVAILEEGMTWKQLGVNPKESQFLEGQIFSVQNVARWFRIAPHKLQENSRATFSNIESENRHHYDALIPWLLSWEQEVDHKLLDDGEEFFAEHNTTVLLRGDMKARANFHKTMFMIGSMTQNEIRAVENLNSREDADTLFIPLNMTPSDEPNDGSASTPAGPTSQAEVKMITQTIDAKENMVAFTAVYQDAVDRMVKKEIKAHARSSKKCKIADDIDDLNSRMAKFYSEHVENMIDNFSIPFNSYSISTLKSEIELDFTDYCNEHAAKMTSAVNAAFANENPEQEVEQWSDLISEQMLNDIMDMSIEAVEAHQLEKSKQTQEG